MNYQEILAANTAEDGTIDHAAVQAEIEKQTVSRSDFEAEQEKAKGAYAAAKAKYNKPATPPADPNGQATPPSGTNEALEAITKLTEQVESLQGQITASNNKSAVAQWEADAVAKGVPEAMAKNLTTLAGGDLERLNATDLEAYIVPNSQNFGAKKTPDAAEQATKREAALADFKKLLQ